ncbi:hypothetical protein HNY73_016535 [Argiope bruennichi]|uniref:Uncharacterized protein n=1 Tax=Argiope bruennichi TaxID=94029 RepID=A0A8T0EP20_ARGBR|nr:hypothetical protein HNY73_016535 [Argiope bruennichi]
MLSVRLIAPGTANDYHTSWPSTNRYGTNSIQRQKYGISDIPVCANNPRTHLPLSKLYFRYFLVPGTTKTERNSFSADKDQSDRFLADGYDDKNLQDGLLPCRWLHMTTSAVHGPHQS